MHSCDKLQHACYLRNKACTHISAEPQAKKTILVMTFTCTALGKHRLQLTAAQLSDSRYFAPDGTWQGLHWRPLWRCQCCAKMCFFLQAATTGISTKHEAIRAFCSSSSISSGRSGTVTACACCCLSQHMPMPPCDHHCDGCHSVDGSFWSMGADGTTTPCVAHIDVKGAAAGAPDAAPSCRDAPHARRAKRCSD